MSNEYGNDSIRSLSDRDAVRMRVATYAGGNDKAGAFTTVREVVANSIDEFKTHHGDEITIQHLTDGSIKVADKGRGCPVDWNESEGKYNYQLIFESLNAGGKFSQSNYNFSTGLNGIGNSLVVLSSKFANIEVIRDGHKYNLEYLKGINEGGLHKEKLDSETPTGTTIHWKPDLEVFLENDFPEEWFVDYLKQQAIVNKGLKLIFINQKGEQQEFYYEDGIVDYLKESAEGKEFTAIQYLETEAVGRDREDKEDYKSKYEIAFCFNNEITKLESYHNSSYLKNGGAPHDAIKTAFVFAVDKLIKDKGKYNKNEKKINFSDVEDSLMIVSNTYSSETSYQNQTKFAITNRFIQEHMSKYLKEQLEIYFIENPIDADKIVERTLINKRSREKALKTRNDAVKQLSQTVKNSLTRPEKFLPCRSKDNSEVELIIIEGDSAMNSVKNSRNSKIQCVMPIKGKSLNVVKSNLDSILKNKEIRGIFQILNCGMEYEGKAIKGIKKFNIDDMSVNKIIIFSDEDEDGMHIRSLIIAIMRILAPQIIEKGHLYVLESPLYKIENGKDLHLVYSEREKNELVRNLTGKVNVQRFKGLGGLNSSMLSKTAMHPENRRLTQIKMDDAVKSTKTLEMFMDKEVEERKEFIQTHGDKYFDFSIYE
ncbi:DNA topoisomerase type IIA subunit B [Priestia flexa]|uniref:DNA topoisomerase type IIA subunit B n=1 Tax=Priestia flexa TaxID=86664 RepID=UPI000473B353|nr:DNA topoisomerase type IIA subunit B [Priestia flexa]